MDEQNSARGVPKSVVIHDRIRLVAMTASRETPLPDSVIYEVHVKGFSFRNPDIPENLRGTYAGLAHQPSIAYLKNLGITAVELMPIHHFIDEGHLVEKGLSATTGAITRWATSRPWRATAPAATRAGQVREFKEMVKALHAAGIEVILDVVYNHTCEGNHMGPMLSWKGV